MLKKLIVIEDDRQEQFDTVEEMVRYLVHPDFYEMTKEEKENILKIRSAQNSIGKETNSFIIKDEITYLYSLLANQCITLLEEKDANLLTQSLDKTQMKNNYIEVNHFAKELLHNYLGL